MNGSPLTQFPSPNGAQHERSVMRSRNGSVLSRGLILKADRCAEFEWWEGRQQLRLQGAPYFRASDTDLGVYGVAQPTVLGLKTVLSVLRCAPGPAADSRHCVWVCTREEPIVYVGDRPFVLREAHKPTASFSLSERAENLEAIERRLKLDVLHEAQQCSGLLLVHEEHEESAALVPTWVAVQRDDVHTVREVWERIRDDGWRVDYHRLPIARDQPLEHNYLDAYTQVIKDADPRRTCFVANCGAGVFRTTFAMIAAVIVRRRQLVLQTQRDPFALAGAGAPAGAAGAVDGAAGPTGNVPHSLRRMQASVAQDQSLLRLVHVMSENMTAADTKTTIGLLATHAALLDPLQQANVGDYAIIRQLCGVLDDGLACKAAVDVAIDACMHVVNLRESILGNRLQYSTTAMDEPAAAAVLGRASKSLEVYYFLIAFSSYVSESRTAVFQLRFVDWLQRRAEIWRGIKRIRTLHNHLSLFEPVADLSLISRSAAGGLVAHSDVTRARAGEVAAHGAQVTGDEFAAFVVQHRRGTVLRAGMLLKCDIWREFVEQSIGIPVRGAVNFRRVTHTNVFGTGQPSVEGIRHLLDTVLQQLPPRADPLNVSPQMITWINLREEPLVYVSGRPYCLRQKDLSLRNISDYSGITAPRLMLLEERLRNDVVAELAGGDGRLLLHTETEDGSVVPLWEDARPDDIATVQDIMDRVADTLPCSVQLVFRRIPITAEKSFEFSDASDLVSTVLRGYDAHAPIIVNCQLGRGRTTLVSVIVLLVERWIVAVRAGASAGGTERAKGVGMGSAGEHDHWVDGSEAHRSAASSAVDGSEVDHRGEAMRTPRAPSPTSPLPPLPPRLNYHVINSLLRVIPHGQEVKRVVDDVVDECSMITNIRGAIEDARAAALDTDGDVREQHICSGVQSLRRYFHLILFQAYLRSARPDDIMSHSFEKFVRGQPVLSTIAKDLDRDDLATITPVGRTEGDGRAFTDEVDEVVQNRRGTVLSASTILKSDFFSGILKAGLPLRVDGMPNLRGVCPLVPLGATAAPVRPALPTAQVTWGSGMPTVDGLRRGLARMGAAADGPTAVVWTNLREEPVLYVNGRPHVLRLADQPLTNVEATGVTTDVVERMERTLKRDLLDEAHSRAGRVLLHDEAAVDGGGFEIIPLWETVRDDDVLTPREVYERVRREGFRVEYTRVAITDEQAPVPTVFSQIEERVLHAVAVRAVTVFNCQMGRGRTTSGMIIAALVVSAQQYGGALLSADLEDRHAPASEEARAADHALSDLYEEELLLRGEYRCILQLVGVLSHGKLAKALTDRVIDRMETIQNLRKAISLTKLRADSAEPDSPNRRHLNLVFRNYLARYGYLVAFASYLLDKAQALSPAPSDDGVGQSLSEAAAGGPSFPSFPEWLRKRREIGAILQREDLD
ncbi:hypothetical protein MSPP1_000776 [Malassezia sp. CBS 17886]|nr:hypothetical protein MSPP1_000776 [Malassezia sp. CBS 17886]